MNREIKFRGKRTTNNGRGGNIGDWVYGCLRRYTDGGYTIAPKTERKITHEFKGKDGIVRPFYQISGEEIDVATETVGQYIELKDKDGKEIFEADILKDKWGVGRVVYNRHHSAFLVRTSSEEDSRYYWIEGDECLRDTKIIGNIHDNRELLEGTR